MTPHLTCQEKRETSDRSIDWIAIPPKGNEETREKWRRCPSLVQPNPSYKSNIQIITLNLSPLKSFPLFLFRTSLIPILFASSPLSLTPHTHLYFGLFSVMIGNLIGPKFTLLNACFLDWIPRQLILSIPPTFPSRW